MLRRRPTRRQRSTRRGRSGLLLAVLLLAVLLTGCSSSAGVGVFAPYRGALYAEEYRTPPANDPRYTQAPTYPSHLLKPVFKQKEEDKMNRPVLGGGAPGMMPMP